MLSPYYGIFTVMTQFYDHPRIDEPEIKPFAFWQGMKDQVWNDIETLYKNIMERKIRTMEMKKHYSLPDITAFSF